jgi:hypothetical protein
MSDNIIKNPQRSIPKIHEPYEPEYVRRGIKVQEAPSNAPGVLGSTKKRDTDNSIVDRTPGEPIKTVSSSIYVDQWGRVIPAAVNTEAIFSIDQTSDENGAAIPLEGGLIDNNDYVDLGYFSNPTKKPEENKAQTKESSSSPNVGDYILMVLGKLITTGSPEKIESKVKEIMYGEDKDFAGLEISIDDIIVLKRMAIKVGIFIEGK